LVLPPIRWFSGFGAGGGGVNRLIGRDGCGFGGESLVFCDIRGVQSDYGPNQGYVANIYYLSCEINMI